MDLGEPWSCHQRYKVMDELHSDIFSRPSVDGWQIVGYNKLFQEIRSHTDQIDDESFGSYTLTKYLLAYSVSIILREGVLGQAALASFRKLIESKRLDDFVAICAGIAKTTAQDLNAEIAGELQDPAFDYKAQLKSPNWCKSMGANWSRNIVKMWHAKRLRRSILFLPGSASDAPGHDLRQRRPARHHLLPRH